MGLIREIDVRRSGKVWNVLLRARVTSPDCLHFVYFERELLAAAKQIPEIGHVEIEWDGGFDWTPESMSEAVRIRMKERRAKIAARSME